MFIEETKALRTLKALILFHQPTVWFMVLWTNLESCALTLSASLVF